MPDLSQVFSLQPLKWGVVAEAGVVLESLLGWFRFMVKKRNLGIKDVTQLAEPLIYKALGSSPSTTQTRILEYTCSLSTAPGRWGAHKFKAIFRLHNGFEESILVYIRPRDQERTRPGGEGREC